MRKCLAMIAVMTTLLGGCRAPNDALIVPGKRVGNIEIGKTKADQVGVNGSISDEYNNKGLGIGFDLNLRVNSVRVNQANYSTREGLRVGSTEKEVVAAYGPGEVVTIPIMAGKVQKALLSDHARHYHGIRWAIGPDGRVSMIIVSAD
jgi:ribosomal protein S5